MSSFGTEWDKLRTGAIQCSKSPMRVTLYYALDFFMEAFLQKTEGRILEHMVLLQHAKFGRT